MSGHAWFGQMNAVLSLERVAQNGLLVQRVKDIVWIASSQDFKVAALES
jgi:hypothetical protein